MKRSLKKEITDLITGNRSEKKQDILVVIETDEPGFYKFRDKIINAKELKELQTGYEKTVKLIRYKNENKT